MRVGIIGAGAAGLTTAKEMIEEGHDVTVFEARDEVGGIWNFDVNTPGVIASTRATSSKDFLAFSDFPFEPGTADFPHHTVYVDYLKEYAARFGVAPRIRFRHRIEQMRKDGDSWIITSRDLDSSEAHDHVFDAVAVCSGLHQEPDTASSVPGRDAFEGAIVHGSTLDALESYRGKRIAVVGAGESAADICHTLAPVAGTVFMAVRRGVTVLQSCLGELDNRVCVTHYPADWGLSRGLYSLPDTLNHDFFARGDGNYFKMLMRVLGIGAIPLMSFLALMYTGPRRALSVTGHLARLWLLGVLLLPRSLRRFIALESRTGPPDGIALSKACKEIVDRSDVDARVKAAKVREVFERYSGAYHSSQPATKSARFSQDVADGSVNVVPGLEAFTKDGIRLQGGSEIAVDTVILCTGYKTTAPFLSNEPVDATRLYENMFVPGDPSMAFIGFARPSIGAMPPIAELQARWFAGVVSGRYELPDEAEMIGHTKMQAEDLARTRPFHHRRLRGLVPYHLYVERLATKIGARPSLWSLVLRPRLLGAVLAGPLITAQYRLRGPGSKPEVAEATLLEPLRRVFRSSTCAVAYSSLTAFLFVRPSVWVLSWIPGLSHLRPQL